MNFQEIENCIIAVKPTMKEEFQAHFLRAVIESENFEDSKPNIQKRMMELYPTKIGYNWASCPVWKAVLNKRCPTGENLFSFDKKTKIYKMNNDEPITEAQREKLIGLVGDLLK